MLVRIENSVDDEGRLADRPRTVLYCLGKRYERPTLEEWQGRLRSITEAEFRNLARRMIPDPTQRIDLQRMPSLF